MLTEKGSELVLLGQSQHRCHPVRLVGTPGAMVALSTRKPPGCDFLPRRKDHIVMVNGLSMENVSSSFAIQTLKTCGKIVNIVSGTYGGPGSALCTGLPCTCPHPGSPVTHTPGAVGAWQLL